ncbi:hypothetical protein EVAR_7453_1 [Eumeta japonica]|uniref:Uncharacterized protein n=1 Tax=Eumeta variegata TaxID=151549 RepID=A0A4C1V789_EUMVA|nr:hypothetical protein EVAR_7453_1 [Eumeta japonica]
MKRRGIRFVGLAALLPPGTRDKMLEGPWESLEHVITAAHGHTTAKELADIAGDEYLGDRTLLGVFQICRGNMFPTGKAL